MKTKENGTNNIRVDINTIEEQKKTADVPALCKKADLVISNQAEYDKATDILKEIKTRIKELDTQRKDITNPIDKAKKAVMDLFKPPIELLEKAEAKIKALVLDYNNKKEKEAKEEQEKLQKKADKKAEEEKKKIDAKIEKAKASGNLEKVEELEQKKEEIVPIDVPVISAKVDTPTGVSFREIWKAEVIDFKILPDEWKLPNQTALDKMASATKGTVPIPGVKFKSEKVVASRT